MFGGFEEAHDGKARKRWFASAGTSLVIYAAVGVKDVHSTVESFIDRQRLGLQRLRLRGVANRWLAAGLAASVLLQGLDLRIAPGDRLLLEGASGSGKSTLAALLTGLRQPQAGLLLMQGLDAPTLGAQWQAMAGTAPQFHENHVLSGSVAFNLLMGRQWPAGPAALAEAQSVCDALGLGELLQRMPAGLHQRIGETGWQLSHGERSRLFLARALLQGAPLTVLDESFAALDPETLALCLRCVQQRAQTLVVIAHP